MDTAPFTLEITQDAPAVFHAPSCSGSLDLRLGDCMDVMATFPDGYFDLAIVDPPYGAGDNFNFRFDTLYPNAAPGPEYFEELRRVSKHQIVWGGNYFPLPLSRCWTVWDKANPAPNFSDVELAWMSFDKVSKMVRLPSYGCQHADGKTIHPTQKPVKLYAWLLERYAKPGQRILDTHLGSGSHAIAAHYAGVHLTACEISPEYFEAAKARIARETSQAELFSPQNSVIGRSPAALSQDSPDKHEQNQPK